MPAARGAPESAPAPEPEGLGLLAAAQLEQEKAVFRQLYNVFGCRSLTVSAAVRVARNDSPIMDDEEALARCTGPGP